MSIGSAEIEGTIMQVIGVLLVISAIALKLVTKADAFIPISAIIAIVGIYFLIRARRE